MINLKECTLACLIILTLVGSAAIYQESFAMMPFLNNEIEQYGLFEQQFIAHSNYNNPYVEVSFTAHVIGPAGITFDVEGYWYGGNLWRLRIMPTAVGHWTYTTSSNDSYLNGLSGEFDCIPSSRPGILIVNPDYPYTFKLSDHKDLFHQ